MKNRFLLVHIAFLLRVVLDYSIVSAMAFNFRKVLCEFSWKVDSGQPISFTFGIVVYFSILSAISENCSINISS